MSPIPVENNRDSKPNPMHKHSDAVERCKLIKLIQSCKFIATLQIFCSRTLQLALCDAMMKLLLPYLLSISIYVLLAKGKQM